MSVPPGWFPDPAGRPDAYRWWDGRGWTRWLGADPQAEAPGPESAGVATAVVEPDTAVPEGPSGRTAPIAGNPIAGDPTDSARLRVPVAVALVVGVLVVALVAVGLTVVLTEDRIRTGPALPPPSAAEEVGVVFEPRFRTARVRNVSLDLPGSPYVCSARPEPIPGAFSSVLSCDTVIHADFAGTDDWYASAGFGIVDSTLVAQRDTLQTAQNLYRALVRISFTRGDPTLKKFGPIKLLDLPAEQALFLGGEVHYEISGLSSTYDRFVLAVYPLADGAYAAFFSIRPNDTPASTLDVLNAAIRTTQVR